MAMEGNNVTTSMGSVMSASALAAALSGCGTAPPYCPPEPRPQVQTESAADRATRLAREAQLEALKKQAGKDWCNSMKGSGLDCIER